MILATIVLILFGVALAVLLALTARKHRADITQYRETLETLEPIHIPALLNLIDPDQQQSLRRLLPSKQYSVLEQKRNRALIVYVKRIFKNAGILIVCADAAAQSSDSTVALAARELQNLAFRTRLNAIYSLALLYGASILPRLSGNVSSTVSEYMRASKQSLSLSTLIPT